MWSILNTMLFITAVQRIKVNSFKNEKQDVFKFTQLYNFSSKTIVS